MQLHMWSTNVDGNSYADDENTVIEVADTVEATAKLVEDLYHSASNEFMHKALTSWFLNGEISNLHAGGEVFWNVRLI